jgi:hypothetical protein
MASRQIGVDMSYDFGVSFGAFQTHTLLFTPSLGVGGRLELSLDLPFVISHQEGQATTQGIGDVRPAAKILILPEKGRRPGLALQMFFKFDTGDGPQGLGTGTREAGFFGIISKEIGDLTLHSMLGLDFAVSGDQKGRRAIVYGAAVDYEVGKLFGRTTHILTEVFGNANFDPAIAFSPASWFFGAWYELSPAWSLNGGLAVGLTGTGTNLSTTVGASFLY